MDARRTRRAEGLSPHVRLGPARPPFAGPSGRPGPLIFLPVITVLAGTAAERMGPLETLAWIGGGYLFWTLTEYWLHRVIFHFEPEEGAGARLHWIMHGVHHDHPNDPMRLVMPPSVSVPLSALFYLAFYLVLGQHVRAGVRRGLLRRLPALRHDALPPAPPQAEDAVRQATARAAHAPPLPGRHARLRRQRARGGTTSSARPRAAPHAAER